VTQIEEALKIYQKAIKAHSEGNWQEAEGAYEELFKLSKSEIFDQAENAVGPLLLKGGSHRPC